PAPCERAARRRARTAVTEYSGFVRTSAHMLRLALAALAALAFAAPARAQIDIMAPFNQPMAMDDARVLAEDLPYGDGPRKHLDIYGPNEIMAPAPVVMFIYGGAWKQ